MQRRQIFYAFNNIPHKFVFFLAKRPPPASPTVDARALFYADMISFIPEDFIYYTDYIFPF